MIYLCSHPAPKQNVDKPRKLARKHRHNYLYLAFSFQSNEASFTDCKHEKSVLHFYVTGIKQTAESGMEDDSV